MIEFNYCWYFKSAVPSRICDLIIEQGLTQNEKMARTGGFDDKKLTNSDIQNMKRKRNSDITWLDELWIYRELHPYVHKANKLAGWNYEWDRSESCQFTKYKLNQYYDWHNDGWANRAQLGCDALGVFGRACFFVGDPFFAHAPDNGIMRGIRSGDMHLFHDGVFAEISAALGVTLYDPQKAALDKGLHSDLKILREIIIDRVHF